MLDYQECARLVASARDRRSKPIDNNTRVEKRGEGAYALRLHATDIATFYEDGRITVNSGGYRTVTTAARLNAYVTRHRYAEAGTWYVRAEPSESDPEPLRGQRTVPKPFHALDPGPEILRDDSDPEHVAGRVVATPYEREHLVSKHDIGPGSLTGWDSADIVRPYEHDSDYFVGYVIRQGFDVVYYGEHRYGHGVPWRERVGEEFGTLSINDNANYEQCPHCAHHDRVHEAWDLAMNGERWGANRGRGFRQMSEMLERFGSHEAWQDAYLADFRAAREARTVHKAWVERNRVLFEDGMELTPEGYAKRPNLKQVERERRAQAKVDRKKKRINKFVADAVNELVTNGMPMPSGGDCWGCCMRAEDRSVEPMGVDHLESHIKERYYVPSMFVNALRTRGYGDTGIYMFLAMDPDNDRMGGSERVSRDTVTRALRTYMYERLLPEQYGVGVA